MSKIKVTLEQFIARSKQLHGIFAYDYSNVHLVNTKTKVNLFCLTCNSSFSVTPNNHLNPSNLTGCPRCGIARGVCQRSANYAQGQSLSCGALSHQEYLKRVEASLNAGCYDLSELCYMRMDDRIIVTCLKHNTRCTPTAKNFLQKGACKLCFSDRLREVNVTSFEAFFERASIIHEDAYEYDRFTYVALTQKMRMTHKACGVAFWQCAQNHLSGNRCPCCFKRSFVSCGETEWLDSLGIPKDARNVWIKLSTGRRVNVDALVDNTVYEFNGTNIHCDLRVCPPETFSDLLQKTWGETNAASCLREEQIRLTGYKVIVMWELDWECLKKTNTGRE